MNSFNLMERKNAEKEWIGKLFYTSFGTPALVVDYIDHYKVVVEFQDEYKLRKIVDKSSLLKGNIKNPYDKSILGIACIGNTTTVDPNKVKLGLKHSASQKLSYHEWVAMIDRCYNEKCSHYENYKDCYVHNDWLIFENFEKWFNENYYKIPGYRMNIDKDILVKGNKIYSPKTCVVVPSILNIQFVRNIKRRNLALGVVYTENKKRYEAYYYRGEGKNHIRVNLGRYDSVEEAFYKYKEAKENYLKELADRFKEYIPEKLYKRLYTYEVEITD